MSLLSAMLFCFMFLNMVYLYTLEKRLIFALLLVNAVSSIIYLTGYLFTKNIYGLTYLLLGTAIYNVYFSIHYIYVLNKVRNNDSYLITKIVKFFGLQKQIDREVAIKMQEMELKKKEKEKSED